MPSDLLAPQDWGFPVPIAYGPGRLNEIADHCYRIGLSRPLVVTDNGSRELPFIQQLVGTLQSAGLGGALYADISPNPREAEIFAGKACFLEGGHDGVIAIGGGSGMDGGKAISLIANNNMDLVDYDYEKPSPAADDQAFPPLICIPTTAGTGAETDSTAMITDAVRGIKYCAWHPEQRPSLAILDPQITLGLPPDLTAWTGCDAFIHALEAYCVPDFHPLCDGIALQALGMIYRWLPTAVAEPDNLQARGGMLVGSCLAGVSFRKGLGLVHAISHMVGAEYDTHHGLTNAVVLPAVLQFNESCITDKAAVMSQVMELEDTSFAGFYGSICDLLNRLEIPRSLLQLDVPAGCAHSIAEKAILDTAAGTNPRPADISQIAAVIDSALYRGR